MNNTIVIIRCDEVEIPELTLSKVVAILHEDCNIQKSNIQVLSQKDIDNILNKAIVTDAVANCSQDEPHTFTPEENAAVYISSIFNNDFTGMFPTRLAIKLSSRKEDDPLVKAVKILNKNSASYTRISPSIRKKYNFTKEVYFCIREVARMLYNVLNQQTRP